MQGPVRMIFSSSGIGVVYRNEVVLGGMGAIRCSACFVVLPGLDHQKLVTILRGTEPDSISALKKIVET